MPKLAEARISYLKAHDSFTWDSRNMPVYPGCGKERGYLFCVYHKIMLTDEKLEGCKTVNEDEHIAQKSVHELVWYCLHHQRMENC